MHAPLCPSVHTRLRCASQCSTSYALMHHRHPFGLTAPRTRTVAMATPMSISDLFDRQFEAMDRDFDAIQRQMDRDVGTAMMRARELERQADADLQRALTESQSNYRSSLRQAPNVDIQRQEERGPGTYRYYERIQITGSGSRASAYTAPPPPAAALTTASAASPAASLLLGAAVLVGSYVTLTAAFNRNYQLTSYAEQKRWMLLALWPLLLLFSSKFREQFMAALRGEKLPLRRDGGGDDSSMQ